MGIISNSHFPSIYKQLGPGERIALSKLAVEHLERNGRPLRIAVDISIWQFQIQSGQGGKNPALRTLYYRLLRLLAGSIQPLFVFDGPHKPSFKRGKKIAHGAACMSNASTKELLKKFGFPYHTAPGEAEAECALLQKSGIVDAVLSEDVDTLMFGCTRSLRHWTAEGTRGNKEPTHVNLYDAKAWKNDTGLESEGMILVALMSGGDYIQAGVSGCGMKTACEAANAGFGKELCRIAEGDIDGFDEWRQRLQRELRTNESKFFRQRHKAAIIPENFPDMTVLGYYKHPAISSPEKLLKLRHAIQWNQEIGIQDLRAFVGEEFNWLNLGGAKKFIRGLAPALLAHRLYHRSTLPNRDSESLEVKEKEEAQIVKAICGRRAHWNTDGMQELRIAYVPAEITGLDLDAEEKDDDQDAVRNASDGEQVGSGDDEGRNRSRSPTKRRAPSNYDPHEVEKIWMLETYVKLGVPLLVETWEEDMRNPKKFASRKVRERKAVDKAATRTGAIDRFLKVSKPGLYRGETEASKANDRPPSPVFLATATALSSMCPSEKASAENRKPTREKLGKKKPPTKNKASKAKSKATSSADQPVSSSPADSTSNPWTLSKRPSDTLGFESPTRYSALGIYAPDDPESLEQQSKERQIDPIVRQSLPSSPSSPTPRKRHSRPTTPISDTEAPSSHKSTATKSLNAAGDPKLLSTPRHRDTSKPSPRKKRSPLQPANDLHLSGQLHTPTSIRSETQHDMTTLGNEEKPLTARRVNCKLDFTASTAKQAPASPATDISDLPSPSVLLSPRGLEKSNAVDTSLASPSKRQAAPQEKIVARKFVALRESLEGTWKHVESWEAVRAGKGVFSGVEILDLTG